MGPQAVQRYVMAFRQAFFRTHLDDEEFSRDGDRVTAQFTFRGERQIQPLGEIAPSHLDLILPMCAIYRVAGDRISEMALYYNTATISVCLRPDGRRL